LGQLFGFEFGLVSHRSVKDFAQLRLGIAVALLPNSWLVILLLWLVVVALKYWVSVYRLYACSLKTLQYEIVSYCRALSWLKVAVEVAFGDPRDALGTVEALGKLLSVVL
jgi:hypothetical protein